MNNSSGKICLIQYIMLIFINLQSQYSLGSEWDKTPWIIAVENSLIQYIMLIFIYPQSQYSLGNWMSQDSMNNCRGKHSLFKNFMLIFIYIQSQYSLGSEWVKTPWIIAVENSLIQYIMLIFIYLQSQYSLGNWMSQDSMNNCRGKLSLFKNIMLIFIYIQSQYSLGSEWVKTPWIIPVEKSLWFNTLCWFSSTFSPNILWEVNESRLHK